MSPKPSSLPPASLIGPMLQSKPTRTGTLSASRTTSMLRTSTRHAGRCVRARQRCSNNMHAASYWRVPPLPGSTEVLLASPASYCRVPLVPGSGRWHSALIHWVCRLPLARQWNHCGRRRLHPAQPLACHHLSSPANCGQVLHHRRAADAGQVRSRQHRCAGTRCARRASGSGQSGCSEC